MSEMPTYGRKSGWLFWSLVWLLSIFLIAPIVIIVVISFGNSTFLEFPPRSWSLRWYHAFFSSDRWIASTTLSVSIALVTSFVSTIIGTLASIAVVRSEKSNKLVELIIVSPIITPSIVLAIGLYILLSPLRLIDSPIGIVLGHVIITAPLVFITTAGALRTTNPSMEMAARTLGATALKCLWTVTIPSIRPAIVAGSAFAFLTSFDEAVIAVFIGGPASTTLPKRMWDGARFESDPTLTAVASLLVLVSILIICIANAGRKPTDQ